MIKKLIGQLRSLLLFLRRLFLYGVLLLNNNIQFLVLLWFLLLITLGVVHHYASLEIESQRTISR